MAGLLRLMRLGVWLLRVGRWRSARALALFTGWVDGLAQIDCQQLSADDLFARLNSVRSDLLRYRPAPLVLATGFVFHELFRSGCKRWFQDPPGSLANRLLSRAGGMVTAEPGLELWRLAQFASQNPGLRSVLPTARSFSSLSDALSSMEEGKEFLARWNAFLRRHGHHANGEVEIATPRWSETPDDLLRIVQGYLEGAGQCDPSRILEDRTRERERILAECAARLPNPLKRGWFRFLLRRTHEWVVFRENGKSEIIRALAAFRRIYLELGDRMVRRGILDAREDIFFLRVEEIESCGCLFICS
jgi:pyruvate,water dikinase